LKGRGQSPEQVMRKLRESDRLLAEGAEVESVCRHLGVSMQTYQRWRPQFKAIPPEDAVRLKHLE
jgi:putative transposase